GGRVGCACGRLPGGDPAAPPARRGGTGAPRGSRRRPARRRPRDSSRVRPGRRRRRPAAAECRAAPSPRARRRPPGRRWDRTRPPKTTATPSSWRRRISRAGCTGVLSSRSLYSTRDAVAAASLHRFAWAFDLVVPDASVRRVQNDVLGARARDAVWATLARALVSGGAVHPCQSVRALTAL